MRLPLAEFLIQVGKIREELVTELVYVVCVVSSLLALLRTYELFQLLHWVHHILRPVF